LYFDRIGDIFAEERRGSELKVELRERVFIDFEVVTFFSNCKWQSMETYDVKQFMTKENNKNNERFNFAPQLAEKKTARKTDLPLNIHRR
jgi:hypothetical protein